MRSVLVATSFVFSVAAVASAAGQSEATSLTVEQRLEVALDAGFAQTNGKGLAVSVQLPGRPMWTGVRGVSHEMVPITPASVFAAGSITKTFTALTILRLAEEGLLGLDDPLHAWFSPYPHVDGDITIRQLLNHTSGLSDFVDVPGWIIPLWQEPDRVWDMEEYFLATIREPYFERGTAWSYSTSGYLLLRMIIEQATASTVGAQYREYVLAPLGLDDTYVCPYDPLPSTLAHGWLDVTGDGIYDDYAALSSTSFCSAAGGQVYTTSADLTKLAAALMHERSFLGDAAYAEMTDFYLPFGHDEPMLHGYGLGLLWFNPEFLFGHRIWGHGGNAPGYAAGMLYLVDHGAVVSIMDNTEHGDAMGTLDAILAAVVELAEGG